MTGSSIAMPHTRDEFPASIGEPHHLDHSFVQKTSQYVSTMQLAKRNAYINSLLSNLKVKFDDESGIELSIPEITTQFETILELANLAPSVTTYACAYRIIKNTCSILGIVEIYLNLKFNSFEMLSYDSAYKSKEHLFADVIGGHLLMDKTMFDLQHVHEITSLLFNAFPILWKFLLTGRLLHIEDTNNTSPPLQRTSLDVKLKQMSFPLSHTLFLLAHALDGCQKKQKHNTLSDSFLFCIQTLMHSYDQKVSWAAVAVYLKSTPCWREKYAKTHTSEETDLYVKQSLIKILPLLVRCFKFQTQGESTFNELITQYSLSYQLLPASLIVSSLQLIPDQTLFLNDIGFVQDLIKAIEDVFKNCKTHLDVLQCHQISMYLVILSFMAGIDDKTKMSIADGNLGRYIEHTLRKHLKIMKDENIKISISDEIATLMTYKLTTASCVFLRSLSRSASVLRQYFTSNNFIDLLLDIVLLKFDGDFKYGFINNEMELYVIIMGLLSNLVLEFSANRNAIDVDKITNALRLSNVLNNDTEAQIMASLALARNALYGEDERFAEKFLAVDLIKCCVKYTVSPDARYNTSLESFNVIRNFLACRTDYKEEINRQIQSVRKYPSHVNPIVQYLCESLQRESVKNPSADLLLTILYGITHLAASTTEYKILLMKQSGFLELLLNLLKPQKREEVTKDEFWELKTVIAWILIDLTSTSDPLGENDTLRNGEMRELSSVRDRASLIMNFGFHHVLKSLADESTNLDFVERAGKAIFQMVVSTAQD